MHKRTSTIILAILLAGTIACANIDMVDSDDGVMDSILGGSWLMLGILGLLLLLVGAIFIIGMLLLFFGYMKFVKPKK
jgi:hypothetical protein